MTDWAIDANIVMQQTVRRLLGACVEYTNGRLFVPERALALACTHYRSIARRRARRITRWDAQFRPESRAPASRDELIVARAIAIQRSFADWASTEPHRNDGLWAVAPATAESLRIAQRLFVAGIARDRSAWKACEPTTIRHEEPASMLPAIRGLAARSAARMPRTMTPECPWRDDASTWPSTTGATSLVPGSSDSFAVRLS